MDFKKVLVNGPAPTHSVPFRSRTRHILPVDNVVQHKVDLVKSYSQTLKMLLNPLKTKTMVFNTSLKYDVMPHVSTQAGEYLDVVEEHKIYSPVGFENNIKHRIYLSKSIQLYVVDTEAQDTRLSDTRID